MKTNKKASVQQMYGAGCSPVETQATNQSYIAK